MIVPEAKREVLEKFGFLFGKGGPHAARTIMFEELSALLDSSHLSSVSGEALKRAIVEENYLSKKSGKTRLLTHRHLTELYGLDVSVPIFRVMLSFWNKEKEGRELLATLCAISRGGEQAIRSNQRNRKEEISAQTGCGFDES
jgi:hypothetical protein